MVLSFPFDRPTGTHKGCPYGVGGLSRKSNALARNGIGGTGERLVSVIDLDQALRDAVRATIAYADLFDFPLEPAEVWRDLIGRAVSFEETAAAIDRLLARGEVARVGPYVVAPERTELAAIRRSRRERARQLWPVARRFGALLGNVPFVRLVAVTGSLAADNPGEGADLDYLIVTVPGRLWLARAMAIGVARLARPTGARVCPNYLLSTRVLELDYRDLFTAHELLQAVPIAGGATYRALIDRNRWCARWLPNRFRQVTGQPTVPELPRAIQRVGESALAGAVGRGLEAWEARRKRQRLDANGGAARFTADYCEGHYNLHRQPILDELAVRCARVGIATSSLTLEDGAESPNDAVTRTVFANTTSGTRS
jgi:hypothetical protein